MSNPTPSLRVKGDIRTARSWFFAPVDLGRVARRSSSPLFFFYRLLSYLASNYRVFGVSEIRGRTVLIMGCSAEMGAARIQPANLLIGCAQLYQRVHIVLRTKDQTLMARKQLAGAYGNSPLGTHPQTGDADGSLSVHRSPAAVLAS